MKASYYGIMAYVTPKDIPVGWPVAPDEYETEVGRQNFEHGIEQVQAADEMGFDWVSFSEHHYSNVSIAPHPALIAAAAIPRVKRARVAILGHTLPLNNPVRVAEELAMIDNLSDGRLVVGMLRGTPNEYQAFGTNPAETRDRSNEGMELILRAWTEPQPFSWEGRYFQYRTVSVWPRPIQQPLPPTYVLGTSKDSSEFAARHHLGLGVSFQPFDACGQATRYYQDQCAANGWEPGPEQIIFRGSIYVAVSDAQAEKDVMEHWSRGGGINLQMKPSVGMAVAALDPRPRANPGSGGNNQLDLSPEEIARRMSQSLVGPPFAQRTNFIGNPDTVFKQIAECRKKVGAGIVDLWFQGPALDHERVMRSLELFAREVMPRMREL